jgi:hypothetical protein
LSKDLFDKKILDFYKNQKEEEEFLKPELDKHFKDNVCQFKKSFEITVESVFGKY